MMVCFMNVKDWLLELLRSMHMFMSRWRWVIIALCRRGRTSPFLSFRHGSCRSSSWISWLLIWWRFCQSSCCICDWAWLPHPWRTSYCPCWSRIGRSNQSSSSSPASSSGLRWRLRLLLPREWGGGRFHAMFQRFATLSYGSPCPYGRLLSWNMSPSVKFDSSLYYKLPFPHQQKW